MASGFLCVLLFTLGLCHQLTDQQLEQLYGKRENHNDLISLDFVNSWVSDQADTFRDEAGSRLFIGAISNSGDLNNGDQNYRQVLSAQYSLQTAENECKWGSTEPSQQGVFNWGPCDAASDYAQVNSNGAVFRGHNLCWGQYNPSWLLNGGYSPSQLVSILQNHITQCIQRYNGTTKTRTYCWDVVNEAISDSSDPTQIYKDAPPWYPAIPDYVDQAFLSARNADKTMRLFYNDYGGEGAGTKSDKIYNMVASMKQRGIPIDGVGLQMHVSTSYYPSPSDVMNNMKRLGALGLEVQITEMDVSCPDQNFSLQAQIYASMLQACLSVPACTSFQTWGFTDKYTWLGSGNYPLPFDINYNPKAAVTSITNTISSYYGINVQLYTCTNQPQQTWSWPPNSYGEIIVKSNSWCLDVENYGTTNGANVWAYPCHPTDTDPTHQNQNWSYNSSTGALVAKMSGRCLDASTGSSKGSNVQLYDCNGGASQKWTWNTDGTIRGSQSGLCLDMGSFK